MFLDRVDRVTQTDPIGWKPQGCCPELGAQGKQGYLPIELVSFLHLFGWGIDGRHPITLSTLYKRLEPVRCLRPTRAPQPCQTSPVDPYLAHADPRPSHWYCDALPGRMLPVAQQSRLQSQLIHPHYLSY